LDLPKLEANFTARIIREFEEIIAGRTNPSDFFVIFRCIKFYTFLPNYASVKNRCLGAN